MSLSLVEDSVLTNATQPEPAQQPRRTQRSNAGHNLALVMSHLGIGSSDDDDDEKEFREDEGGQRGKKRAQGRRGKRKTPGQVSFSQPDALLASNVAESEGQEPFSQPVPGKGKNVKGKKRRPVPATNEDLAAKKAEQRAAKEEKARIALQKASSLSHEFQQRRLHSWCVCFFLNPLTLDVLHALAVVSSIELHKSGRQRLAKHDIMAQMCTHEGHTSADEIKRVLAGPAAKGMVKFYFPEVLLDNLSVIHAFHLYILGQENRFATAGARARLHDFRAHFMQHFVTNYNYYVVRGKQNRTETVGADICVFVPGRFANFFRACLNMMDHYNDKHCNLTCGHLRKGQVCTPSFTWSTSPEGEEMRRLFHDGVVRFTKVFSNLILLPTVQLVSLELEFPDQSHLRNVFELGINEEEIF